MCGIFGFALSKPQKVALALKVLTILETHQYTAEEYPVGGHGAGIYFLDNNRKEFFTKIGKTNESPAKTLSEEILKMPSQARMLIGHVRRASPDFLNTIQFKEYAQPYVAACNERFKIISVHNGFWENYIELRKKLRLKHRLESEERGELIDSEVLPHFFEELLLSRVGLVEALDTLAVELENQKGNTVGTLLLGEEKFGDHLAFVHYGKTRGLTIWGNSNGEVVFSSRKEPVKQVLGEFLRKHNFEEKLSIDRNKPEQIKPIIFALPPSVFA